MCSAPADSARSVGASSAVAYLLIFGVGTAAGMMLITAGIALPIVYTSRFTSLNRYIGVASGLLSLGFGLFLAYRIGFVHGLFALDPRWTPQEAAVPDEPTPD